MFNIFKRYFSDPLDDVIDKEEEENEEVGEIPERDGKYVLNNEEEWPYDVEYVDYQTIAGKRVKMEGQDGNIYAGQFVRDAMESRRYKPTDYTWFGYTKDAKHGVEHVGIPHESLFKHTAIFGVTGYGKSTVLKNMMFQWIVSDYGLCFIDPKGDDSEKLLRMIPEHRKDDVVWVEPGVVERDKTIGFNFFDTYSEPGSPMHEKEVSEIESDFVELLKSAAPSWGATMDIVARAVSKQLIKAPEPYNIVDMYKILRDEEELNKFVEEYGDDVEKMFLNRLLDKDEEELDPLNRRLQKFAEKPITREVISHTDSKISVTEAVEEGKIMLVSTASIPDDELAQLVASALINRIWSTIRARSDIPMDERTPYFLAIDEFDNVVAHGSDTGMDMEDILSRARSFRLSVLLANQQPNQLPDDIRDAVYSNCNNLFTFNPGVANYRDAQSLSKGIGDIDASEIMSLGPYQLLGRLTIDGKKTSGLHIHTFPEYPPRRSEEKADELKERSISKYGVQRPENTDDLSKYGVLRFFESDEDKVEINESGDTITTQQALETIHSASIRNETEEFEGKEGWVHVDDVRDEISKYIGDVNYDSALDQILEKIPEGYLDRNLAGDVYLRLTPEGEQEAFEQDTGSSASGGKMPHRELLREGHHAFTKLGYDVKLPTQEGDQQPDGVATPPIRPMEESEEFEEAKELREELKENNKRMWELFGSSEIALEAESTTIERPKQTIKNLAKAVDQGRHCVFLVKDGNPKKGQFEYWARAGENILKGKDRRAEFVASMDTNGNRTFYSTQEKITLKDGSRALQKKSHGQAIWHETGKENPSGGAQPGEESIKLVLESTNGEILASFDDPSELHNASRKEFPYHYYRDSQRGVTVVEDHNGNLVGEYENLKQVRKDGYRPVTKPLIPEEVFPMGDYPDPNSWTFVIIPSDSSEEPKIYEDGNLIPLFSGTVPDETPSDDSPLGDIEETTESTSETQTELINSESGQNRETESETSVSDETEKDENEVPSLEELGFVDDRPVDDGEYNESSKSTQKNDESETTETDKSEKPDEKIVKEESPNDKIEESPTAETNKSESEKGTKVTADNVMSASPGETTISPDKPNESDENESEDKEIKEKDNSESPADSKTDEMESENEDESETEEEQEDEQEEDEDEMPDRFALDM